MHRHLFAMLAVVLAATFALAACGTVAATNLNVAQQTQVTAVIAAINIFDTAGLHGMDERIQAEGKLETRDQAVIRRLHVIAKATQWPEALQREAQAFTKALEDFQAAFAAENVAGVKAAAHDIHERGHDLSNAAYTWLRAQAGIPVETAEKKESH